MTGRYARLTVLLDAQVRRAFDAACEALDTNPSAVLRELIRAFLGGGATLRSESHYTPVNMAKPAASPSADSKTARLTILIDPAIKEAFEQACARNDLSASQVVRRLIRAWVEEQPPVRRSAGRGR